MQHTTSNMPFAAAAVVAAATAAAMFFTASSERLRDTHGYGADIILIGRNGTTIRVGYLTESAWRRKARINPRNPSHVYGNQRGILKEGYQISDFFTDIRCAWMK